MQYTYKAKNKDGLISKGTIETDNEKTATMSLREKGLYLIDIKSGSQFSVNNLMNSKVPVKDKIVFTEQLGVMIKSGLSIVEALEALREETQNKAFSGQINQIISDIQGGTPLSSALSKHPDTFSEIYVSMIKSGEESGKVDLVLNRLSVQMAKDYELRRKIKGAFSYPIFVLVALTIVMVLILIFVIPQLTKIFVESGAKLPASTRLILGMSDFVRSFGIWALIALVILVIGLMRYRKTVAGKHFFDRIVLKLPIFGTLLKKIYMARFSRTFSALISSGLPLLDVFKVSGRTIGNSLYQNEIEKIASDVKAGQPVSTSLKKSALFPQMIGQLAAAGEKSGDLDEVFTTLANFYDRDVDSMTANMSTLLEPFLMVILGVGIGFVIIAVLQPIYGLVNVV